MEPTSCWQVFCETGDPLAYMLYKSVQEGENPSA